MTNPSKKELSASERRPTNKRSIIAKQIASLLKDGQYVNLGIGIPTLIPEFIDPKITIILHAENGMLGYGPAPFEGQEDADLINAGKETITELPGCSYFGSPDSFAMVRGGHLDTTVLGAMQVSQHGDLANWMIPGKKMQGMGGAMDMVAATLQVIVAMEHTAKDGSPKIVKTLSLPATGLKVVHLIVTELGQFDVTSKGLVLTSLSKNSSVADIKTKTDADFLISKNLSEYKQ